MSLVQVHIGIVKVLDMSAEGPITIKAISWNMGNQKASKEAVEEIMGQIAQAGPLLPTVLAISTQEELADDGERLQDQILQKLNAKIKDPNQHYVLVKTDSPQFHTTMAGANNSKATLAKALLTDRNRVSSAILVKLPYELQNAKARIDFEPGKNTHKNEKKNKSIITIKGELYHRAAGKLMDVSISGGHLNARSDSKRRAHARKYFKNEGLSAKDKNFNEIYKEATTFRVIMGDFNERDYLMRDGTIKDKSAQTNFGRYGFDMNIDPQMKMGKLQLHGTYGHVFKNNDNLSEGQLKATQDTRGRENVAKGGFLDRVAYICGLPVEAKYSNKPFDQSFFKLNQKGTKWFFHKSDHLPVIREFKVTPPPKDNQEKFKIVGEFIKKRLPINEIKNEIQEIEALKGARDYNALLEKAQGLMYHDSTQTHDEFIRLYAGISQEIWNDLQGNDQLKYNVVINALEKNLFNKEMLYRNVQEISAKVNQAVKARDTASLTQTHNLLTKCQNLKNAVQELRGEGISKFPPGEKELIIALAERYSAMMIDNAFAKCNNKTLLHNQKAEIDSVFKGLGQFKELTKAQREIQKAMDSMVPLPELPQLRAKEMKTKPQSEKDARKAIFISQFSTHGDKRKAIYISDTSKTPSAKEENIGSWRPDRHKK